MNDRKTPFDEAVTRSVLGEFSDIPTREEDIPLSFTAEFEEDVRQFIEYTRYRNRYSISISRILLIAALAGILMISSSLLSIGSVVAPKQDGSYIFNMTSGNHGDYYHYKFYFDQEIVDAAPDTIRDVYFPTYVPEGYIGWDKIAFTDVASASWETTTGKRITYCQWLLFDDDNRVAISYDPEKDVAGVFELGDFDVFRLKTDRQIMYLWSDHQYYYELCMQNWDDEETLQKVFLSIEWMPDEVIFED